MLNAQSRSSSPGYGLILPYIVVANSLGHGQYPPYLSTTGMDAAG
jgi:hypothetical protein